MGKSNRILWGILGAWALLEVSQVAYRSVAGFETWRETRVFYLEHALKTGQALAREGRNRELSKYFRDALGTGLVDYFEITHKDKTEIQGEVPAVRPLRAETLSEEGGWAWGKGDGDNLKFYLASGVSFRTRLAGVLSAEAEHLPLGLVFLAATLAFAFLAEQRAKKGPAKAKSPARESKRSKIGRAEANRRPVENTEINGVCGRASLRTANLPFALAEDFFQDAIALVQRYGGEVPGLLGQEFVFLFQGQTPEAARLALAAARDLAALATARGYVLAVALAEGVLEGGRLPAGYALLGAPVDTTARYAADMGDTAVWVSPALARLAGTHARFRAQGEKKGAVLLQDDHSFATALEAGRQGNAADLAYHRNDHALAAVLASLCGAEWEREAYVGAVNELRRRECRRVGREVAEALRALLEKELERNDSYRLSSVLALAPRLLARAQVDAVLEKLFLRAVHVKDRRVRANAVELFTRFFPEREVPELRPLLRDEDHRVSANALIKAACERFDEKIIARIEERVRGGSVAHVASALHAMGEIALYYRTRDPLFLGTKLSFLRLFEEAPRWAEHPNPMVRRQALLAAQKLQNAALDARLKDVFRRTQDPELLALFGSTYGWHKETAKTPVAA